MINIYCDESCHLENDKEKSMVLGAVWCQNGKVKEISREIKQIKISHGIKSNMEIKWTKISPAKIDFYKELVIYFFNNTDLHFRSLVVPDKSLINHEKFKQTHDDWYYKMYFTMLKNIIAPNTEHYVYLDIKDTCSAHKVRKLKKVLANNIYDYRYEIIKNIQNIRSEESIILQLADLLIGAVGYINRGLTHEKDGSTAKRQIVDLIKELSGYELTKSTLPNEKKFNIFIWNPQGF